MKCPNCGMDIVIATHLCPHCGYAYDFDGTIETRHDIPEPWDLTPYGIRPAACIDGALVARLTGREVTARPDRSQRPACGCLESVDIGAYDTCPNGCLYCYADHGRPPAPHDPEGELLTGVLRPGDQVRDRVCRPALSGQTSLFSSEDR